VTTRLILAAGKMERLAISGSIWPRQIEESTTAETMLNSLGLPYILQG